MQSGIDSSRLRLAAADLNGATRLDSGADKAASAASDSPGFFGPQGPSFRDVLDAVNPLNHIPVISDIFAAATGHQPSTASKLVGGALLGGPIGFVASLASVIYTQEKGATPMASAYAALTGERPTAVASAAPAAEANIQLADASPVEAVTAQALAEIAPASGSGEDDAKTSHPGVMSALTPRSASHAAAMATAPLVSSKAVLDLYGTSPASAHRSYRSAQFRPYLQDVTQSKVL